MILAFLRLIRIVNLSIIALSVALFYYFILVPLHNNVLYTKLLPLTHFEVVLFILSLVFVAAGGNIINDYFDFELDKQYKPERPLAMGAFTLDAAMYMHAFFAFAGIIIGFYLGYKSNYMKIGYMYVICALLLYGYSAYLKKVALAGNIVISALTGFVFVLLLMFEANFLNTIHFEGAPYAFAILKWQAIFYGGFAFITNLAREIVKDLEDVEGDEAFNINTLPVAYGVTTAKTVTILVLLGLLCGLGFFMKTYLDGDRMKEFYYLLLVVVLPTVACMGIVARAKGKKNYALASMLLKIIMLMGILSIPAFYLFNK